MTSEEKDLKIESLEQEIERLKPVYELLCVLHGDGGHYTQKHGINKAIKDAGDLLHTKWVTNVHMSDINEVLSDNSSLKANLNAVKSMLVNAKLEIEQLKVTNNALLEDLKNLHIASNNQFEEIIELKKSYEVQKANENFFTIWGTQVLTRCSGNCGMNYCDENGCVERKRNLVPVIHPEIKKPNGKIFNRQLSAAELIEQGYLVKPNLEKWSLDDIDLNVSEHPPHCLCDICTPINL
jgi:hypothetical protein